MASSRSSAMRLRKNKMQGSMLLLAAVFLMSVCLWKVLSVSFVAGPAQRGTKDVLTRRQAGGLPGGWDGKGLPQTQEQWDAVWAQKDQIDAEREREAMLESMYPKDQ